ncbi:carboxypeptidase M32 [Singulisphaera acidiphila]|uniref:Metal-dependent carboxypeptidase n=1 Tax=Singulisphaera acidiphila (strain ATCC BAA-1392 / DSM 18658 / VKM B-2454 / MOB10) TaxID=886293 RepID=L0DB47_SINAD|nr:carboxypeptidase M32 [Singulisphaera acidiphila]AGA26457.1 Zn-dependent carboxypeptidase [Singulisphaera acidiphila DSM 18658]
MQADAAYEDLIRRSREASLLASCSSLLGWDEQTYMPTGGVEHRSRQMALLAGLHHEKATDPIIGELLEQLDGTPLVQDADSPAAVNIRELKRNYQRLTRLPRSLVEEMARTVSISQQEWITARSKADYAHFQPWLERIVALKQREAECLGDGTADYDALLDEYEPGAKSAEIAVLFDALRTDLVPLVRAIAESPIKPNVAILRGEFPVDRQRIFGELVAGALGFDFSKGRLDTTAHPFCSGIGPGDCRITTRFHHDQFADALFGIMHEVGHGLYEQGLDPAHFGTPMGESVSLGIHESQSRLWENAVGRSRPFWSHFLPIAQRFFPESFPNVSLDEFHLAINRVEPSLIRVEADEVTYNLHILVRFELERELLSGQLTAADLPEAWNRKYAEYLGIRPSNNAEGCLQDIHWSAGLFGYFPTYTLGNIFAAQLFAQANTDLGNLDNLLGQGNFAPLLAWLRERVHLQGQRYRSSRLVEVVTGSPLNHAPLVQSLKQKYEPLYRI